MKRIWLNKGYVVKLATKWTSYLFAFLGLIGTFVSLSDLLDNTLSIQHRIFISSIVLISTWVILFIICSMYIYFQRWIMILEVSNGYHIYVQYGDVFNPKEVKKPQERRNIVIPVNRCFDTLVDDDLVSSNTLHGIALKKLYSDGSFTVQSLNDEIQKSISRQSLEGETISEFEKRSGNLKRFPIGTVAEVKTSSTCTFFFLGLSTFDENLHAHTTNQEYVLALMKLLEFCNERSQKFPVIIPLIGAGASETKKSERDILEYMIKLIKLNKDLINCDIHIVVRDSGKETIAITGL